MSRFFIDRPVFAWVIAIVLMMVGGLSLLSLPVAQYPPIAPPAISITVNYPGASAETVQSTVVQVIEQQLNGIDHLLYFTSESDKDGSVVITLSFEQGTDPDIAQVQVQNKLQLAQPRLPAVVQQQGLRVAKATKNFLMVVGFVSKDGSMNAVDIADFIASTVQDPISRTPGVGDFQLFGTSLCHAHLARSRQAEQFRPDAGRCQRRHPGAERAGGVRRAGRIAGARGPAAQRHHHRPILSANPRAVRRHPAEGAEPDGAQVRLRDVARIEFGGETYGTEVKVDGHPASGIGGQAGQRRQRARYGGGGEGHGRAAAAELPARHRGGLPLRHLAVRARCRSRRWSRRCSKPSCSCSWSCTSSCRTSAPR